MVWSTNGDESKVEIMVSTSTFRCGIDVPTVHYVFHFKRPINAISYVPDTGRCARYGKTGFFTFIDETFIDVDEPISGDRIPAYGFGTSPEQLEEKQP